MPDTVLLQHFRVATKADGTSWELGRGAMGVTYKAVDTELGGTVALKVINSTYLNDAQARERFLREARAAAYLHHPNIASVFHLGREGDNYFYAMEFVEGETLQAVVAREGALPPRLALRLVLQAAQGLFAANERGLIHRDIKPANLMLTRHAGGGDLDDDDLLVKVIDFGLAKSTAPTDGPGMSLTGGGPIGTPYYMSPEQIEPEIGTVDARSDIYSLGVTLWCLLTGKPPFQGTQFQIFSQHLHQPPPQGQLDALGLPAGVGALLARMLAKDPAQRPAGHRELINEIKMLLRAMPATAADTDPDATMALAPTVNHGVPPAQPPAAATAGFPLVEVLRARGSLPAADVLRLLGVLAPETDAAGRNGGLELRPASVLLRFSPPPANLDALPSLSVRQWPTFSCVLRARSETNETRLGSIDLSNELTLLPGSPPAVGVDDVTRLATLTYELLAGQPPGILTRDAFASPVPALGESANAVLCRAVTRQGKFASAAAFAEAFAAAAQTDGSLARADGTTTGRPAEAAAAASPAPVPRKPSLLWPILGALLVAACVAGWWFIRQNTTPPTPRPVAVTTPPPIQTPLLPSPPPPAIPSVPTGPVSVATPIPGQTPPPPAAMPSAPPPATPTPEPQVAASSSPPLTAQQEEEREEKLLAEQEARTKAARTLRVPKQFPVIQAAIDAANPGDTVLVGPGRYREALRFKEGIRLIGADRDKVIITAPGDADVLSIIDCAFGKISDLTFRQTPPPDHKEAQPAIFFRNSGVQFVNCRVLQPAGIGIYLRGKDHSTVENCEVRDAGSDGIHMMDTGTAPTIRGNHVSGGRTHGILLHMHGNGTIINNLSEHNAGSGIIIMGDGVNPQVQGNRFLNNGKWGIQITRPAAPNVGADNVIKGNEMGPSHEDTPAPVAEPMPKMEGM